MLQVWDLRQTKRAVQVFDGLPNSYAQTNVSFSPDERLILTGTSVERAGLTGGLLILFSKSKLELVRKVGLSATQSVVCTYWHPRLNQVFYFWSPALVLRVILRSVVWWNCRCYGFSMAQIFHTEVTTELETVTLFVI